MAEVLLRAPYHGMKIKQRARDKFAYFTQCEDTRRLPSIPMDSSGMSAIECFHVHESEGHLPPCREPELLSRALNGKEWHGLSVTNIAEDYVGPMRVFFADDLKQYPDWVCRDILGRASQIAMDRLGFVPTYVLTGEDFTTKDVDYRDFMLGV